MRFHFKHFSLNHGNSTMKVGTDAVLLGAWVEVKPDDEVLDIGTGCGILPLMLAQRGVSTVDAVDLDGPSAEEAAMNFQASQWREHLNAFHDDIKTFDQGRRYDLIISNPPFFVNSFKCDADRRNQARHTDTSLSFKDLIANALRLLKPDGRLSVVLPEKESKEFFKIAYNNSLYIYRIQYIIPVEGKDANRVNIELKRSPDMGSPRQSEVSYFTLRNVDGKFTDMYNEIVRDFYLG